MNPLILRVCGRLVLPVALAFSLFLLWRGHNEPGGGFVAGLVLSTAFILQYIVSGTQWVEANISLRPVRWIAMGLLMATFTGLGALFFGYPFLTTHTAHLTLPLLGEIHVASALFFDIGVFTLVVGSTMLILTGIAHQSVRSHRYNNARADDEDVAHEALAAFEDEEGVVVGGGAVSGLQIGETVDQAMEAEWPQERLATLKIRERIRTLVAFRLEAVAHIDEAVRRALAVMAEERPQSVEEWRAMLKGEIAIAAPPARPGMDGNHARAVAAVRCAATGPPTRRTMRAGPSATTVLPGRPSHCSGAWTRARQAWHASSTASAICCWIPATSMANRQHRKSPHAETCLPASTRTPISSWPRRSPRGCGMALAHPSWQRWPVPWSMKADSARTALASPEDACARRRSPSSRLAPPCCCWSACPVPWPPRSAVRYAFR